MHRNGACVTNCWADGGRSISLTWAAGFSSRSPTTFSRWHRVRQQRRRHKLDSTTFSRLQSAVFAAEGMAAASLDSMTLQQSSLLGALLLDFAIQLAGWALAVLLRTDKTYDMFGSIAFATLSIASLVRSGVFHWRQVVVTSFACIWTLRLGGFLIYRVFKTGGDSRLEPVINKPGTFLVYFLIQGVWVFVSLLPVLAANTAAGPYAGLAWTDVVGWLLWGAGFTMEAVADAQKWAFKSNPANQGRFIDTGLWSLARYPNYGGEMLLWTGTFAACAAGFDSPWWYLSFASPLFVTFILTSLSGIPIQERQAQQRWGAEAAFQQYRRRTRLLLPIPRWGEKA